VERLLEAQEKLVQGFGAETFAVPLPFQPTAGTPSLPGSAEGSPGRLQLRG
jgi:para-nitrobenzyl esterase